MIQYIQTHVTHETIQAAIAMLLMGVGFAFALVGLGEYLDYRAAKDEQERNKNELFDLTDRKD